MIRLNENDKVFFKKMLLIGIPVVFQNLISIGINLIDTLMIGKLGEQQLAAVGAANQVYFIYMVSLFGLYSGVAVHTAQYFGAGDIKGIRRVLGIDFVVGIGISMFVSIIAFSFAPYIIGIFSRDPQVVSYGVDYIRIAAISYIFSGISSAISYNSRAIQQLAVPTTMNFLALCINGFLNYVLIFGKMGFEQYGVKGAAIATLTARILELVALSSYIYFSKNHIFHAKISELFGFSKNMFKAVMKTAVPVVFTESCWSSCTTLIFAAFGILGTTALAVVQVATVFNEFLQSVFFGVGNATAMIIGENLGKNDKEEAYRCANRSIGIVVALNVIMTIVLWQSKNLIAGFYDFEPDTNLLLIKTITMMALLITPKMLAYILIVGIFRAGGDTMFSMKVDMACNIGIAVPLAFLSVTVFGLTLPYAMAMVVSAEVIKIIIFIPRYFSKKWINLVTEHAIK